MSDFFRLSIFDMPIKEFDILKRKKQFGYEDIEE